MCDTLLMKMVSQCEERTVTYSQTSEERTKQITKRYKLHYHVHQSCSYSSILFSTPTAPLSSMLDPLRLHAAQLSTHPFLGPAKEVSHGHPSLGIRVADSNTNFGTRSDDLIGNIAVCNNDSLEGRLYTNASENKRANGKISKVLMA